MSGENDVQVTLGAEDAALREGMSEAQKAVAEAIAQMRRSFEEMQLQTKTSTEEVGANFMMLANTVKTTFAAVVAGTVAHEITSNFREWAEQTYLMQHTLGVTAEEAETLNTALDMVGTTTQSYITALRALNMHLQTNEQGLNQMGIATRNANGELRPQQEIFTAAVQSLNNYKEGTDRNNASLYLFRRQAAESMALLRLTPEVMNDAAKANKAYGLSMDDKQLFDYQRAQAELHEAMQAFWITVAKQILPSMYDLINALKDLAPLLVVVGAVVKILMTAFDTLVYWLSLTGIALEYIADMSRAFLSLNWDEMDAIAAHYDDLYQKASKWYNLSMNRLWVAPKMEVPTIPTPQTGGAYNNPDMLKQVAKLQIDSERAVELEKIQMEADAIAHKYNMWQVDVQTKFAVERRLIDEKYAVELNTQNKLMEQAGTDLAEQTKIRGKMADLEMQHQAELAQNAQAAAEAEVEIRRQVAAETAKFAKDSAEAEVAASREAMQTKFALHQASEAEQFLSERDNIERIYQIAVNAAEAEYQNSQKTDADEKKRTYDKALARTEADAKYQTAHDQFIIRQEQQARELAQQEIDYARQVAQTKIELERSNLNFRASLGLVTERERITEERGLLQKEFAEERARDEDTLAEKEKIYGKFSNEYKKQLDTMDLAQRRFNMSMVQNWQTSVAAMMKPWITAGQQIYSSFTGVLKGLMAGTMSWGQAFLQIVNSVVNAFIDMGAKMLEDWIIKTIMKKFITKTSAADEVLSNAAVAASGAYAATASIPYVGPALAPLAAANAFMQASAWGALVTAAGGWDVPEDSLAYIHKREMVLPANLADTVRGMAANGGAGGGPQLNAHIHAWDTVTGARALKRMLPQLAREYANYVKHNPSARPDY